MKTVEQKKPSRLRKLDWEDRNYYSELSARCVDDQIDALECRLFVLRCLKKGSIELCETESRAPDREEVISDTARLCRDRVRDLKVQINLLQKCLERVEVTGDWSSTAPVEFSG